MEYTITKQCKNCRVEISTDVTEKQFDDYLSGKDVDKIFPDITILRYGLCPDCYSALMEE